MVRAAVALLVAVTVMSAGCFPHNAQHRQIAKYAEGGSLLAGILVSALSNTGADCDAMAMQGIDPTSCRSKAKLLGTVGLVLILTGLVGFIATVSTAEDDNDAKPVTTIVKDGGHRPGAPTTPTTTPTPTSTPTTSPSAPPGGTGATAGSGAGSGSSAEAGSATTQPSP